VLVSLIVGPSTSAVVFVLWQLKTTGLGALPGVGGAR
jgi:hypothetical protein